MISRRTTRALAEACRKRFGYNWFDFQRFDVDGFADFLFEHDYDSWFHARARNLNRHDPRQAQEFIMGLHTGETQRGAYEGWTLDGGRQLGQRYLRDLAEDLLQDFFQLPDTPGIREYASLVDLLLGNLHLDGYIFRDGRLLDPDSDVIDAREEAGLLESLYSSLNLPRRALFLHHLQKSAEHYLAKSYGDSISNSRHFFEVALCEVAQAVSLQRHGARLPGDDAEWPVRVRKFLEREGFLTGDEVMAVAKVYGLISGTGGHPNMSGGDEARFARQLALILTQYVLVRLDAFHRATAATASADGQE